jgi:hypothetical protein
MMPPILLAEIWSLIEVSLGERCNLRVAYQC